MKIMLLSPPFEKGIIAVNGPYIGNAQLAGVLLHHDIDVTILDCNLENLTFNEMTDRIQRISPRVIATGLYPGNRSVVLKALKKIKEIDKEIVTVIGGSHPGYVPEVYARNSCIDFVIRGEGEYTLLELILELDKNNNDFTKIPGLAFYINNEYVCTRERPLIENLDALPFPSYELLPLDTAIRGKDPEYNFRFISMSTSRGCPFQCRFCQDWKMYNCMYRERSIELIVDEIQLLVEKCGIEVIEFIDSMLNVDNKRITTLIDLLLERKIDVKWGFSPRVDYILRDRNIVPRMVEAGFSYALLGVESHSQVILDENKKNIQREQVKECIKLLQEHKVGVVANYIIGWGRDTRESIKQANDFLNELDPDGSDIHILTPYPGTSIWDEAVKKNQILDFNFNNYDRRHPVLYNENLSPEELTDLGNWLHVQQFSTAKTMRGLYRRNRVWSKMITGGMKRSENSPYTFEYETHNVITTINDA